MKAGPLFTEQLTDTDLHSILLWNRILLSISFQIYNVVLMWKSDGMYLRFGCRDSYIAWPSHVTISIADTVIWHRYAPFLSWFASRMEFIFTIGTICIVPVKILSRWCCHFLTPSILFDIARPCRMLLTRIRLLSQQFRRRRTKDKPTGLNQRQKWRGREGSVC